MALGLSAALGAAVVFGFAAVLQARAVRRMRGPDSGRILLRLLGEPLFLASVGLSLCGFALHLVAVRTIPLYLAQAGIAGSLAVTALLAVLMIHEQLTPADWAAVVAISLGLTLLAVASGDIGDDDPPTGFSLGLYIGIVVVALLAIAVARSRSVYVPSVLGVLAGLGFAGSGLAARVLPGLSPSDLWSSPATYALPLSGGLAYAIYSFALRRGSVTEATGPMIVLQTVAPALVGVWLLGDQVRDGWATVAVVGFVMTAVGAVALARFESGPDGGGAS
jgi:drug/metabolite transporter (DMT)-like permease